MVDLLSRATYDFTRDKLYGCCQFYSHFNRINHSSNPSFKLQGLTTCLKSGKSV